jgi:hypothetical protein
MRCTVTLERTGGAVLARCAEYPECVGRGESAEAALALLRASVLFWLESCPCDQTADPGLVLDVVSDRTRGT